MPVVEPVVDEDKLRQLLDEGAESAQLDYKSTLDLHKTRDKVELAKDAGAMMAQGGYIVVGADSGGEPTGALSEADLPLFDESRLRGMLKKWLPEPFELLAKVHQIDGNWLALIYVAPRPDGICIFAADGQHEDAGKSRTVFSQGDIFVRHGSSSERWNQHDIADFRRRVSEQERERWLEELEPLIQRIQRGRVASDLVRSTSDALDYRIGVSTFDDVAERLIRGNDLLPIRKFFMTSRRDAETVLTADEDTGAFELILRGVSSVTAAGVLYTNRAVADEGSRSLAEIYSSVGNIAARQSEHKAASAWFEIIAYAESVGGCAVRQQDWRTVRRLALPEVEYLQRDGYWRAWLRHGLTMAARSGVLDVPDADGRFGPGLIARAHQKSSETQALRVDVDQTSDRLLNSICQFDFLACVVAALEFGSDRGRDFYPSFSRYSSHRTAPAARRLIRDNEMRRALLNDRSDADLAAALQLIDRLASREGIRFSGWHGFTEDVESWISSVPFTPFSDDT